VELISGQLADLNNLWKSCACTTDPDWGQADHGLVRADYAANQKALQNLPLITYKSVPKASCDSGSVSSIPNNIFSPGVWTKFCHTVESRGKTKQLAQIVDSDGNVIPSRKGLINKRALGARGAIDYTGVRIALEWSASGTTCDSNCEAAYNAIGNGTCETSSSSVLH